jgi:hypothetical protein
MKTKKPFFETTVGKILKIVLPIFLKKQKIIKTNQDKKNVDDVFEKL